MTARLFHGFLRRLCAVHATGAKAYGMFLSEPELEDPENQPTDVFFFDARRNRRNHRDHRAAFEAQGEYFREHDDAGFVVDGRDVLELQAMAQRHRHLLVAPFHSHRRQPANFSLIDYKLHNPLFRWHLVVSMRDPRRPTPQAFAVEKPFECFGIDAREVIEGSGEAVYPGREVSPIGVRVRGSSQELERVARLLGTGHDAPLPAPAAAFPRPTASHE